MEYNARWSVLAIIGICLGIFAGALRSMSDADIWFQLLAGRYALAHGSVPSTDFFVYAGADGVQLFGGWGFGAVYELAVRCGGLVAASMLNALVWTAVFAMGLAGAFSRAGATWREVKAGHLVALSMAFAGMYWALYLRMGMRAEETLALAWVGLSWAMSEWGKKGNESKTARVWFALPAVAWLEAMLHTGGFVLLALLPLATAGGVPAWSSRSGRRLQWVACCAGMAALPLANPNGAWQAYGHLMGLIGELGQGIGSSPASVNMEYLPLWDPRHAGQIPKAALLAAIDAALLWSAWRARSLTRGLESLVCFAFLAMGCVHERGIGLAAVAAMTPLFSLCLSQKLGSVRIGMGVGAAMALAYAFAPAALSWGDGFMAIQSRDSSMKTAALTIKASHPNGANIFTKESGAQLAYELGDERFRVSSSGHLIRPNPQLLEHLKRAAFVQQGWEADFEKYGVDFVCLPIYVGLPRQGVFYPLTNQLAASQGWRMHSVDPGSCMLYERLKGKERLSERERDEQLLGYLAILAQESGKAFELMGDRLGERMKAQAMAGMDIVKSKLAGDGSKQPSPAQ